jgi:hypothetical protein
MGLVTFSASPNIFNQVFKKIRGLKEKDLARLIDKTTPHRFINKTSQESKDHIKRILLGYHL